MSDTPSFLTSQGEREERWNFYKLAIKERNFERLKCDRLERELAAAIAQRDKAVEALKHYGQHVDGCVDNESVDCICGYTAAMKECGK
jgi:hypothetical protein